MTPGFRQLLNRFSMIGFERQLALMDLLGDDPDWKLSPRAGTATFGAAGTSRTHGLQLLGTRANESNTWLWSWAGDTGGVPDTCLAAAKKVRNLGRKRAIGELAVEALPLDNFDFDAHTLALVATAIAELPGYFRFPYGEGALYAALEIPDLRLPPPRTPLVARVIREALQRIEMDHRTAITSYLESRGARVQGERTRLLARWPDGQTLEVAFDEAGHFVDADTSEVGQELR